MTNPFTSTVTQLLRDNTINSNQFWGYLETKKNSFYYSLKLFDILGNQRKRQKYTPFLSRMSSMMLVLQYLYNMDKKDPKLVEDSRQIVRKIQHKLTLAERWIFQMFLESSSEKVFVEGFLRVLGDLPLPKWQSQIEKQRERQKESKMKNKNMMTQNKEQDAAVKQHNRVAMLVLQNRLQNEPYYGSIKGIQTIHPKSNFTFAYACFIDYIFVKDLKLSQNIYNQLIKVLYQLLELSSQVDIMMNIAMVLHFVQSLIKFYVLPYREVIKGLLIVVRQFRNFPIPVGTIAHQIIQMLYDEIKVLGFTYRYNMRVNIPSLDVMSSDGIDYTAYLISHNQSFLSNNAFCSIDTLRKALILNMIWKVNIPEGRKLNITSCVCKLPLQTAYQYYSKLLKIEEVCMQASTIEQIVNIQTKAIISLVGEIQKQAFEPSDHVSTQLQEMYRNQQYNFFQFPHCEIKFITLAEFIDTKSKVQNFKIILQNQMNSYKLHQQKFRIVFRGSDREFRSIVQIIGEIYQQNGGAIALRTLELYILPQKKQQCLLAAYIAKHDYWYSQFIYNAFLSEHFYPEYDKLLPDLLPGLLLSKSLQIYIKEAARYLSVRLFKCCLEYYGQKKTQYVYFSRSVEFGLSALVNKYRYSKQKYQDMDYMQILLQKVKDQDKINQQITVVMDVNVCDMFGEDIETVSFQQTKISDLRISNVPLEYFMGKEPIPYLDTLELCYLKSEHSKEFDKLLKQKSLFKKPYEEMMFSFRSIFCYESIKGIFIQSNINKGMTVCIDGEIFNNIKSIKIDPMQKKLKENRLPIKTFIPFRLN